MRFHGFQGSEVDNLWRPVATYWVPIRKNVGFLNPSKEQGARLDLSSLTGFHGFHRVSSILMEFHEFHGFGGSEVGSLWAGSGAPTRKNVGILES